MMRLIKPLLFISTPLLLMAHAPTGLTDNRAFDEKPHKSTSDQAKIPDPLIPLLQIHQTIEPVLMAQLIDKDQAWRGNPDREKWIQEQLKQRRRAYAAHRKKIFPNLLRTGKRIDARNADKLIKSMKRITEDMHQDEATEFLHSFFLTAYVLAGHSPTERRASIDTFFGGDAWEYYNDISAADLHAKFATQGYLEYGTFAPFTNKNKVTDVKSTAATFIAEYGVYVDGKTVADIMAGMPSIKAKYAKGQAKAEAKRQAERRKYEAKKAKEAARRCAQFREAMSTQKNADSEFFAKMKQAACGGTQMPTPKTKAAGGALKGLGGMADNKPSVPTQNKATLQAVRRAMDSIKITNIENFKVKHHTDEAFLSMDINVKIDNPKGKDVKHAYYGIAVSQKSDPNSIIEVKGQAPSWKERGPLQGAQIISNNSIKASVQTKKMSYMKGAIVWENVSDNSSDYNFTPFVKSITYTDGSNDTFSNFRDVAAYLKAR